MKFCIKCGTPFPRLYIVGSYTCRCGSKECASKALPPPKSFIEEQDKMVAMFKKAEQEAINKQNKKKKFYLSIALVFIFISMLPVGYMVNGYLPKWAKVFEPAPPMPKPSLTITQGKENPIIRLYIKKKNQYFYCTGFIISDEIALTAEHCVDGLKKGDELTYYNKEKTIMGVAKVWSKRPSEDQAMIVGDFKNFIKLPVKELQNGIEGNPGPFIQCGYALGGSLMCNQYVHAGYYFFFLKGIGGLYAGMSGGPMIDVTTGHVVGVNSAVTESFSLHSPLVNTYFIHGVSNE